MKCEEVESAVEKMIWTRREEWAKEITLAVILSIDNGVSGNNKNFNTQELTLIALLFNPGTVL